MIMTRVKAKDVAQLAQVDPSTVSRVLGRNNSSHRYDPKTVERVREAARHLGYRPSGMARALRTGKTMLVGMVVADIANPFFAELAGRIERHIRAAGYRLLLCSAQEQGELQNEQFAELIHHPVAGLIVSPVAQDGLREATELGLPLITIDRPTTLKGVSHVGLDDVLAGRMLGEHLRDLGYDSVGVVMPETAGDPGIEQRLQGLQHGLGTGQIEWTVSAPQATFTFDDSHEATVSQVCQRFSAQPTQAVVGLNLDANLIAVESLFRMDAEIPQRVGLAGIDDFPAAPFLRPPMTVVAQPLEEIAARAVAMLMEQINATTSTAPTRRQLLSPTLIKRGSLRQL